MLTAESEPAVRGAARPESARSVAARTKSSGRGQYNKLTDINTVHSLLVQGVVNPRPECLRNHASETFLEQPPLARRKGWDKWITSGGRKGATETWISDTGGVLKRYVRVVDPDPAQPVLKGAQYSLLKRLGPGAEAVEDKTKHCWIINRDTASAPQRPQGQVKLEDPALLASILWEEGESAAQGVTARQHQYTSEEPPHPSEEPPQMPQVQTTMELAAGPGQAFVSFQSSAPGEEGLELGAIGKHWQTALTFQSTDPRRCAARSSTPAAAVLRTCIERSLRCRLRTQCAMELVSNSRARRATLQSGISVQAGNRRSMRVMW